MSDWINKLWYGDNLSVLRENVPNESVDLIYLDPPFNSKANYNVLFKDKTGDESEAQIEAFGDTWHWDKTTPFVYDDIITNADYPGLANLMSALLEFLGRNDMMAYLVMMAIRLIELHRVLKPTGSIYLHCDPTASHYLKLLMDAVFGKENFRNEIIWSYATGGVGKRTYGRKHDVILFSTKTDKYHFYPDRIRVARTEKSMERAKNPKGARISSDNSTKLPSDVFDIQALNPMARERMGYPTQKPEALLERIIMASSNEGDIVLDPFCGCGTTVVVAEKLNRHWIGIDITHLAINLIEKRMKDKFSDKLTPYEVFGTPKSMAGAIELAEHDKYQFEWWALSLINARPYGGKKKGADKGIDGIMYFKDEENGKHREIVVQVKGGHVTANQVRDLAGVVSSRKSAEIGIFLTLKPPTKPMIQAAEDAGIYSSANGKRYRRIQILTIEDVLENNIQPEYPFRETGGFSPFKKAEREAGE